MLITHVAERAPEAPLPRVRSAVDPWAPSTPDPVSVSDWKLELMHAFWRVRRHLDALGDPVEVGTRQKRALRAVKVLAAMSGNFIERPAGSRRSRPSLQDVADHFGWRLRTTERAAADLRDSRGVEARPRPLPRDVRELP